MAAEEIQLTDVQAKGLPVKRIAIVVAALALVAAVALGTLAGLGMLGAVPGDAPAEPRERVARKAPLYVSVEPPFTVNLSGNSRARFLQVAVDVMSRDPVAEDSLKQHMPVIRNDLVMLFSSKTASELATVEGKQTLQRETLAAIQKVLERETGDPGIEAVYFPSFVMQ